MNPEQTPDAEVREIAAAMREAMRAGDRPSAFAVGRIQAHVDDELISDAEFRAKTRTVLAALDLALGGA